MLFFWSFNPISIRISIWSLFSHSDLVLKFVSDVVWCVCMRIHILCNVMSCPCNLLRWIVCLNQFSFHFNSNPCSYLHSVAAVFPFCGGQTNTLRRNRSKESKLLTRYESVNHLYTEKALTKQMMSLYITLLLYEMYSNG